MTDKICTYKIRWAVSVCCRGGVGGGFASGAEEVEGRMVTGGKSEVGVSAGRCSLGGGRSSRSTPRPGMRMRSSVVPEERQGPFVSARPGPSISRGR